MFEVGKVYPIRFPAFVIGDSGVPLREAGLTDATEVLVFDVAGAKHALLTMDMNYHHVAQGNLEGHPFLVTFCCLCQAGALMRPCVSGNPLTFQCEGSHHGTFVMKDIETGSYWHPLSGRALHGTMCGSQLPVAGLTLRAPPLQVTTAGAAVQESPGIRLHRSRRSGLTARILSLFSGIFHAAGWLPWPFSRMPAEDARLSRVQRGLGVIIDGAARFYKVQDIKQALLDLGGGGVITDTLASTDLTIQVGETDGVPFAVDQAGEKPLQLFCRWYGFAFTYPGCSIWQGPSKKVV